MLKAYLKSLAEVASTGDAREESYYSTLEDLLNDYAESVGKKAIHIRTLPKKTEGGNPDFRVWDGQLHIVGYIEAKAPTTEDLDEVEETEQLLRYRHTFPNLILTNFLEFRFYRDGGLVDKVCIGRPFVLHKLGKTPPVQNESEFLELLDKYFSFSLPKVTDAKSLAIELAKRTRFLRDIVAEQLSEEREREHGVLLGFYEAFKKYLIGRLTPDDFADLYAQTVTYGLFAARTRASDGFSRRLAFDHIPRTIGILRDVFRFISLEDLPPQIEWIIDDISEVLAVADARGILDRYYREGKGSDPIVHFYETFLAEYDPEERERRGVYYTPEPVVSYIVRSLHVILKRKFKIADGLASEDVTLLDPAAGTMTFIAWACREAVREFEQKYGTGGREEFIRKHLLGDFYAFELMMAPYAVGHLKMSFFLEELGHHLSNDERFQFYLTNTLEMAELEQTQLPGMASLAEESHLAGEIKRQQPVLVILGNPPYSGISSNVGEWITGLIEDYKYVDGNHFGERKHWLQDDYVKFLRFAQWKIEQAGRGVVGMITNHAYLDNPTFRGMRQSLMKTFDEIHVLDLHGSAMRQKTCPDGSRDENVFDIRQGVAIAFLIKKGAPAREVAKVLHGDLWGSREYKYGWLDQHDVVSTSFSELEPQSGFYFYVPRDESGREAFDRFTPITQVFPVHVTGIVTARDRFVYDSDRDVLLRRIGQFRDLDLTDDFIRTAYSLNDTRGWTLADKRRILAEVQDWRTHAVSCLYRPFDARWLYFHPDMVDWGRWDVMRHMVPGENLGLMTCRQLSHLPWRHAMVSDLIVDDCMVSNRSRERGYFFPLWTYPDSGRRDMFSTQESGGRKPNLASKIVEALADAYGEEPSPEEIFRYVYAILYAATYRQSYAEFLRRDFPRIPFSADIGVFRVLAGLGERLAAIHLLRSPELDPPLARFEGDGDNRVAKSKRLGLRYEPGTGLVYINNGQYFGPASPDVWEYEIGAYRVLEKWLKDRRDRQLTLDEIKTYCKVVTAIKRTIEIQEEIDALYPEAEADVIKIVTKP